MKRKNVIFNTGKNSDVDNYVLNLAEKNDDPDYWLGLVEHNVSTESIKKRKNEKIELKKEEKNNNDSSSETPPASSISNMISSVIVPVAATVVVASLGLAPGLEDIKSVDVLNSGQNNISANIISIEPTNNEAKYHINLNFDNDVDEKFDFNDEDVALTLTNDFTNYEQTMQYNNTGPDNQEYSIEPKNNSKISSKYTIKQNDVKALSDDEGYSKHLFTVDGFIKGLNPNMNYTLNVKSKGKVLAKQLFKTKSDEDMLPLEIINTEMKIDTYRDIASFEMLINTRNWNEQIKFNDEEFVLRLSGNNKSVDFNISTDYSYILNQDIELIYDLSQNKTGLSEMTFVLRGDISKLAENTKYTITFLRKNSIIAEKNFNTSSTLEGLEIQTETN